MQNFPIFMQVKGFYLHYKWLLLQVEVMKSCSMDQWIQAQISIQLWDYHGYPTRKKYFKNYVINLDLGQMLLKMAIVCPKCAFFLLPTPVSYIFA